MQFLGGVTCVIELWGHLVANYIYNSRFDADYIQHIQYGKKKLALRNFVITQQPSMQIISLIAHLNLRNLPILLKLIRSPP